MNRWKLLATAAVSTWLFGALQMGVSSRIGLFGASPDFLLVQIAAFSPFLNRLQGGVIGFFAGMVNGSFVGANMTQYVLSRTLTGFLAAWANDIRFAPNSLVIFMTGFASTVFANIVMLFMAPPAGIGPYLGATILSAVYNGVLVLPLYALLKRILDPVYR